jgi:formylglycine-generating enzyme required for sulfatase activity
MRTLNQVLCCLATILGALLATITHANVFNMTGGQTSLQFVTVGDPGNAADTTGYGAVAYTYQIAKYDVTTAQYCQFLNAVATTSDPYGLYTRGMPTDIPTVAITQSGSPGSYSYSVTGSYSAAANCPVFDVTWGDAARFCNWLQNRQPTGVEGPGTTETGAYTLNGATSNADLMAIIRNAGATYFIPSENEWYKAAYYKGGGTNAGYWLYPTQSNTAPINILSSTGTNNANFYDSYGTGNHTYTDPTNYLTPVGAFAASPGPYGTFDQGGDVFQWNETAVGSSSRGLRGGNWGSTYCDSSVLASSFRYYYPPEASASYEDISIGFRVASVPEPGSISLVLAGAISVLAYAWRKKKTTTAAQQQRPCPLEYHNFL